jgi:hypothetical protein
MIAAWLGFPRTTAGTYTLASSSYVSYLTGDGSKELRLPVVPLVSVASIYDDPDRTYDDSVDLVAASDFTVFDDEGLVLLKSTSSHGAWTTGSRAIKATYTAGWSSVPADIKNAVSIQVAHMWSARDHIGRSKVSQGGGSMDVAPMSLLPEVKRALAPWRLASTWIG